MTVEPSFVLVGPDGVVLADGIHTAYPRLADARADLAARRTPILLGALPFDMSRPTALFRPQVVQFAATVPDWPHQVLPTVRIAQTMPSPEVHRARVEAAVAQCRDAENALHKVVLARALLLVADAPLDARTIVRRLVCCRRRGQHLSAGPQPRR